MKIVAPAKINWTLEALGRREDGYHEIRSVMQTIDLCDEVTVEDARKRNEGEGWVRARSAALLVEGELEDTHDDLALRAALALEEAAGRELPVAIRLRKRIPVASGLGGGTSDAAAVLRMMNALHALRMTPEELAEVGNGIGSDVPFFVHGGTALVEGRGERVTPLPDVSETWLVLVAPPIRLLDKTKRMYEALTTGDFSDGSRSEALAERLRYREAIREDDPCNAFERAARKVFDGLETHHDALRRAGAEPVHLVGAGPTLFTLADSEAGAREIAQRLGARGGKVFVTRTLTAAEATAITD